MKYVNAILWSSGFIIANVMAMSVSFLIVDEICTYAGVADSPSHWLPVIAGAGLYGALHDIANSLASLVAVAGCLCYFLKRSGKTLADIGVTRRGLLRNAGAGLLFGGLYLMFSAGTGFVLESSGYSEVSQLLGYSGINVASYLVVVTVVCATNVIVEELIFRSYMAARLLEKVPKPAAIAIGGAIFGLCHVLNPGYTICAITAIAVSGCVYAALFYETKSIWMPAGVHFANNFWLYMLRVAPPDATAAFWQSSGWLEIFGDCTSLLLVYCLWRRYAAGRPAVGE